MPYSQLLKDTIKKNKFTNKDIIEQLNKQNISIDKSYLSKLINGKIPPPREEISIAIAKMCGIDERLLVIEGYFDKAPKEIKELLEDIRFYSSIPMLSIVENNANENIINLYKENLSKKPISEFLLGLLDNNKKNTLKFDNNNILINSDLTSINLQMPNDINFSIDNSDMSPIIPKDSKITLEICEKYKNGDIVAIKYNDNIYARYYFINNSEVLFTAIDKNSEVIDSNNAEILGKVKKVISEIQ